MSITSKGFALYGCICIHTFKKIHFLGNGVGAALLLHVPRYEKSYLWGVILLLLYRCIVNTEDLGQLAKVLPTTELLFFSEFT